MVSARVIGSRLWEAVAAERGGVEEGDGSGDQVGAQPDREAGGTKGGSGQVVVGGMLIPSGYVGVIRFNKTGKRRPSGTDAPRFRAAAGQLISRSQLRPQTA